MTEDSVDVPPALVELDLLERALTGIGQDEELQREVLSRLQTITARYSATLTQASNDTVAEQLQSSSADEVLRFIDNELGRSNAE